MFKYAPIFLSLCCLSASLVASDLSSTISDADLNNKTKNISGVGSPTLGYTSAMLSIAGASITNTGSCGINVASFEVLSGTFTNIGTAAQAAYSFGISGGSTSSSGSLAQSVSGSITLDGGILINTGVFGNASAQITLSGGELINTASVGYAVTDLIEATGASITNSGDFGSSAANVLISGGTFTITGDSTIGQNAEAVTLSTISLDNVSGAQIATSASVLNINSGGLTNSGSVGYQATEVIISGGSISNMASFAYQVDTVNINGGIVDNSADFASGNSVTLNFSGGSLTNSGTVGYQATQVNITAGSITNEGSFAYQVNDVNIEGGVIDNSADFASGNSVNLYFYGGVLTNSGTVGSASNAIIFPYSYSANVTSSGNFGPNASYINFDSGSLTNTGVLGTSSINLYGGDIVNDGVMIVAGGEFIEGSLNGSGELFIFDYVDNYLSITQGTTYVGTGAQTGYFNLYNNVSSYVIVATSSTLAGGGTLENLVSSGNVSPGYGDSDLAQIDASGFITLNPSSSLSLDLYGYDTDSINCSGSLSLNDTNLYLSGYELPYGTTTVYTLASSGDAIIGTFAAVTYPYAAGSYSIQYNPTNILLTADIYPALAIEWLNGSGTFEWFNEYNWSTNTIPAFQDDLIFEIAQGTISLQGSVGFADSMTFNPVGGVTDSYGFADGTLTLQGSTQPVINGGGTQIFAVDVVLTQSSTIDTSQTMTFNNLYVPYPYGTLTLQGGGNINVTGNFAGSASLINFSSVNVVNSALVGEGASSIEFSDYELTNSGTYGHLAGSITMTNAYIVNSAAIGEEALVVTFNNGNLNSNSGSRVGNYAGTVSFEDAFIEATSNSEIATGATYFDFTSSIMTNNGSVAYEAINVTLSSGSISNNASFAYNAASTNLMGGDFYNAGDFGSGTNTVLTLSGGDLSNTGTVGYQANTVLASGVIMTNFSSATVGYQAATVTISGGSVSNAGSLALNATSIGMTGGYLVNTGDFAQGSNVTFAFSGGTVYNTGTIGYQAGTISASSGSITNDTGGNFAYDVPSMTLTNIYLNNLGNFGRGSSGSFSVVDGTIYNNNDFGYQGGTIAFSGGSITNDTSGSFTYQAAFTTFSDVLITNSGQMGQQAQFLSITGGSITNNAAIAEQAATISMTDVYLTNVGFIAQGLGATGSLTIINGTINNTAYLGYDWGVVNVTGGSITNSSIASFAENVSLINLANLYVENDGDFVVGSGGSLSMTGVSLINTGTIGYQTGSIAMTGGSVTNSMGANFGYQCSSIILTNIIMNNDGVMGESGSGSISIINGTFSNNGIAAYDVNSVVITGGSITNNASGSLAYNATVSASFENVYLDNAGDVAQLASSVSISGATISNSGTLAYNAGSVTISGGSITVTSSGVFARNDTGGASSVMVSSGQIYNEGVFAHAADLVLSGGEFYNVGNLADSGVVNVARRKKTLLTAPVEEKLTVSQDVALVPLVTEEAIGVEVKLPLNSVEEVSLAYEPIMIQPIDVADEVMAIESPLLVNTLSTPIVSLSQDVELTTVQGGVPTCQLAQFSLEKLDLLIHKELESALYDSQKGTASFVLVGYDHLNQSFKGPYYAYTVNSYYLMAGASFGRDHIKGMGAVGVSGSKLKVQPVSSKISYTTVYGTLGLSSGHNRWAYGLDALFGYSFLRYSRSIWNLSLDGKISYAATFSHGDFKIYDQLGYLYGQRNGCIEKGKNASLIRNAIGLALDVPKDSHVKVFIDAAWLYEHYFNNNSAQVGFFDGSDDIIYSSLIPIQQYARLRAGLKGNHKRFEWQLAWTGLFGSRFTEQSASLKLGYRF